MTLKTEETAGDPPLIWLIGWPLGVPPLPAPEAWAEDSAAAWTAFDELTQVLGRHALPDLSGAAFVLTTRPDAAPLLAGADPRRIVQLRGCVSRVQCSGPCADLAWRRGSESHCPRCGLALRPNVRLSRDPHYAERAGLGQAERWADTLRLLRGQAVEIQLADAERDSALVRLRRRLSRELSLPSVVEI